MDAGRSLARLLEEWDDWASTADRRTDGWEARFPRWLRIGRRMRRCCYEPATITQRVSTSGTLLDSVRGNREFH